MKIENNVLYEVNDEDIVNGTFVIPNSVTEIGKFAFAYCNKLESVIIPNSVKSIGIYAFSNCNSLKSIIIPNSVIEINDYAFYNCHNLELINVNDDNEYYSSEDGVLFNKDKTKLIQYSYRKKDKKYIIPDSVTEIEYYAFENCKNLKSIIIPDSVTIIGKLAFDDCINLKSIAIPNSITVIGDKALMGCNISQIKN